MKQFIIGLVVGLSLYFVYDNFLKSDTKPFTLNEQSLDGKAYMSDEVDYNTLNSYVKNYRKKYNGYTFAFNVDTSDIEELRRVTNCMGVRVYFGLKVAGDPSSGTAILVGINGDKSDAYIKRNNGTTDVYRGIDECSPCPRDCPDDTAPGARLGKLP